ncbi:MAG: hypothetical protein J4F40_16270 [Alphaproteobacteria bacterium]|nr:hypothetical protein [Alphaproteobacteria bacterium]
MVDALTARRIDEVARGEVGDRAAAQDHGSALAVTVLDTRAETGCFALATADTDLAACLDRHIDWLTASGRIGLRDWLDDASAVMGRARQRAEGEWSR